MIVVVRSMEGYGCVSEDDKNNNNKQHLVFAPSDIYSQFLCKEKRESEVLHVTESTAT